LPLFGWVVLPHNLGKRNINCKTMSKSPESKRPKPKLFTIGTFFLPFIAILFGSFLLIIREYFAKGSVSGVTLGAATAAFVIGLIIIVVLSRHANKPEE
jgi:hypothetical protein